MLLRIILILGHTGWLTYTQDVHLLRLPTSLHQSTKNSLTFYFKGISQYGAFRNFKVNVQKSEILSCTLPKPEVDHLQSFFPFRWQVSQIF